MAYLRHAAKWVPAEVRSATASGAITDKALVYFSAEDTIKVNDLSFRRCAGIAMDSYADGDTNCDYLVRGRYDAIAAGAISVNQGVVPDGTTGRVRAAYENEKGIVGHAIVAADTAGDRVTCEFDFVGAEERDEIIYYNAAMTANVSPTIGCEAGTYLVKGLYIENSTANAVTGGLNVGTSDDGAEIFATLTVGASGMYWYLPADAVAVAFELTEDDELFFHAETAWNSASLIVKLVLQRLY